MLLHWGFALLLLITNSYGDKNLTKTDKKLTITTSPPENTTEARIAIDYVNYGNFNEMKKDSSPISSVVVTAKAPAGNASSLVKTPLGDAFSAINMITSGSNGITIDDMFVGKKFSVKLTTEEWKKNEVK